MFRREHTSHSSRILGRFSHFGYDSRVWAETESESVVEISLCTAEGADFQNAPARKERTGDGDGNLGGMGNTNAPLLT